MSRKWGRYVLILGSIDNELGDREGVSCSPNMIIISGDLDNEGDRSEGDGEGDLDGCSPDMDDEAKKKHRLVFYA